MASRKKVSAGVSDKPDLAMLIDWHQTSTQFVRMKHWEWFVIDQFLKGNQNIRGNPNDNSITVTQSSNKVNYPINRMKIAFRAVRGYVTRHKPMIEIDVDNSKDPNVVARARRDRSLIARDNKLNNYDLINKKWVYFGVKYGVGYRQVGYDPEKKCCIRWTIDPFDLLIGSRTGDFKDAPYLIKNVVRSIEYLKNKYPDYKGAIAPDNELADDEYKKLALQIENQDSYGASMTSVDKQTKIVHECWYRLYKKNKAGGFINKTTFIDTGVLDEEETPFSEFPFVPYYASVEPDEVHPDGHMKDSVAPQRMFNLLNEQELQYNHLVNRGKYMTEKDSGFQVINTKDGQVIRVNKGKTLRALNPPSVNSNLPNQRKDAEKYIDDLTGMHDASYGNTPSRVISGDAIEAIQSGDANNIADLRDNFEIALAEEAAWILKMYSYFEAEGVIVNDVTTDDTGAENVQPVAMVGAEALKRLGKQKPDRYYNAGTELVNNGDYCDVFEVLANNQISVSVQSKLGETRQAKLELLLKLREAGLPLTTVLKLLEFPNAADVSQRIAEEAVADAALEAMKAQMSTPPVEPSRLPPEMQGGAPQIAESAALEQLNNQAGGILNGG